VDKLVTVAPAVEAEPAPSRATAGSIEAAHRSRGVVSLALLAVGVVFGDIGTSPIYAFKACFDASMGVSLTRPNVFGVVSLIAWALTLTVSVKYVAFIMRADNHGEGGILALLALIRGGPGGGTSRTVRVLIAFGLFGAALLYGDGIITPAISVLSAIEGVGVATPHLHGLAVPLSVVILVALFAAQRYGTHRVGGVFGPVMVLWFLVIGGLGAAEIVHAPAILAALSPTYAIAFFAEHGLHGMVILGAVVLAVTGAEALYADMGYFGRRPIRVAWFALVFPTLILNYAGQGALLLRDPAALENPFFRLTSHGMIVPLVVLATAATIIASQALISGAFALTNQAVQLGYCPRLDIRHTAPESEQIYVPSVNRALMIGCVVLVLAFRSSDALGAAYGIAVTGTMAITSVLFVRIAHTEWHWPPAVAFGLGAAFLVVDLAFLAANALKINHGGWVPILIALVIWRLMTTWAWGRAILIGLRRAGSVPIEALFARLDREPVARVPGTAVFLTSHPDGAPRILIKAIDSLHVLQEQVVLVNVVNEERPDVPAAERVSITAGSHGFFRVTAHYGFLEQPNLPAVLRACRPAGIALVPAEAVYFVNGETLVLQRDRNPFRRWRKALFTVMVRNARNAPDFFGLPPDQVIEFGQAVTI